MQHDPYKFQTYIFIIHILTILYFQSIYCCVSFDSHKTESTIETVCFSCMLIGDESSEDYICNNFKCFNHGLYLIKYKNKFMISSIGLY
jgi:hypothetical protein